MSFQYQSALAAAKESFRNGAQAGNFQLAGGSQRNHLQHLYDVWVIFAPPKWKGRRAIDLLKLAPQNDPRTEQLPYPSAMHLVATLCCHARETSESEIFFQQAIATRPTIGRSNFRSQLVGCPWRVLAARESVNAAEQSLDRASLQLRQSISRSGQPAVQQRTSGRARTQTHCSPNYATALKLVDESLSSPSPLFKASPQYYPIHIRGQILLRSGEKQKALVEFRRAVSAADSWRHGALPGDTTNTQTVVLLHEVYQDFAHLAAQISLETNDRALRDEAFEVLPSNRAASLREQLRRVLASDCKTPRHLFRKAVCPAIRTSARHARPQQ